MAPETSRSLAARLDRDLPAPLLKALRRAAEVAASMRIPCYLVGGPVRDLLLGRSVDDLDLVLEGDAVAVAERFAGETGGRLVRHAAFGTASVSLSPTIGTIDVDFITARRETYPAPAVLPVVEPAGLAEDLRRRDFTINTLALSLRPNTWGEMIDLCDGQADLRRSLIRVLHDRSFVDDPTRIVRAARFAARLGHTVEPATRDLIEAAVREGMIERTSPIRILHELWLLFLEPAPEAALALLDELGALAHIVPGLRWTDDLAASVGTIRAREAAGEERRLLMLGRLAWQLPEADLEALAARYPFSATERRLLAESAMREPVVAALHGLPLRPSELDRLLHGLSDTTLHLLELLGPDDVTHAVQRYREELRPVRPLLNGDDLKTLGIQPGPRYRVLLAGLRAAQLDGHVTTRAEAEEWVRRQDVG